MLSCFPHLTDVEYASACRQMLARFHRHRHAQDAWLAVDLRTHAGMSCLRVTTSLRRTVHAPAQCEQPLDSADLDDHDDEALPTAVAAARPVVHYDVVLSPAYRVPVLYASIADAQHRYPPTFATLYEHVIPPQFRAQAAAGGVIGGITVADHPVTHRPVFFVHPCHTAEVMQATVGGRDVTADEYLIAWMGALGKGVGLDVPFGLVCEDHQESALKESNGSRHSCFT